MRTMSKRQRFWFGIALILIAVVVFISSIHLVDVPGPMTADKPEFTFEFTKPLLILSVVLALTGEVFLAWKFRDKT
jgi:hypothetical protein